MKRLVLAGLAAVMMATSGVPAAAQGIKYSDGYTFLKAVKDRDGNKATELADGPRGSIVINSKDGDTGDTALHIVVKGRDLRWLSFILARRPRTDIQNKAGSTPLGIAAQIGWIEGAEQLLARGAAVDGPSSRGETPLILAVQSRDAAMVRLLLGRGANPKRADSAAGYSALDYARQDGRTSQILRLLEAQPAKAEVAGPN